MAETLASIRKSKDLTQGQLGRAVAERTGTTIGPTYAQRKIARFEGGQASPTPAELTALAEVLGRTVDDIAPLVSLSAPYEASAIIDQLARGDQSERSLFAVCLFSMARKEALEESALALREAIEHRNMWVAAFVPYPGDVTLSNSRIFNNLVGYYTRVQRSISDSNLTFRNRLDSAKADRIGLFFPKVQTSSLLIPPVFRQFSMTIKFVEQPYAVTKTLHMWTPGAESDTVEPVKPTGVYTMDEQIDAWESYFGEIIPHWIEKSDLSAPDPHWERIR